MNEYQKRVLKGRKDFSKLVQQQEEELLSIYEEASKQISRKLSKAKSGGLTERYLRELNKSIYRYTLEIRTNLSRSITDGMLASSQIASTTQAEYFNIIAPMQDINSKFNKMFALLPDRITKQLIGTNYYSDGKTLDKRLWDITSKNSKDIDRLIKINISKGTNAKDLANELDSYINPKSRMIPKTLESGMSKNIAYQAQRLARTSLTHANTETYIQGSKMNPFCKGLKWNLSPSHSTRMHGKTDICDEYAGRVFKVKETPIQHPNCLCYLTQEVMDTDKARDELIDWVNGEGNPKLDKWLEDYGEEFGIDKNESKISNKLFELKEENSGIIDTEESIKENIKKGKYPLDINVQAQNKHIRGTNQYIEGRSLLTISIDEAQELINEYSGIGIPIIIDGEWKNKERIIENDKIIGVCKDSEGGSSDTSNFMIHYNYSNKKQKQGTHIVPSKP
ncbi:polymorphic toxin type 50 domain-containing protein [Clostridium gasigenes]|uniref:polymorphic toxin type 50 domain-containing protein n=1 Tax=Clostridium gasigenes TaxID=94869 RepID=UPI001C0C4521|nr:hypothetical protein [Clostridium gasigenes]